MPLPMHNSTQGSAEGRPANIIAIAAGKGGVGKSTVTVNLAVALQRLGYTVGVLDTDLYGPSIRRMLPEDQPPAQNGPTIIPANCRGIRMLSLAYFRKENEAAAIRAPIANNLINHFLNGVQWGGLDYLLIDFPPGTGDIQLTLCQKANLTGAIMVTTPQEVAVMDVRKAMHLFEQLKVPVLGIIENMSYYLDPASGKSVYLFGRGGGERLAAEKGVPFLGQVPVSPVLSTCGDEGTSVFDDQTADGRIVTKAFEGLTAKVQGELEKLQKSPNKGLGSFEMQWKELER